MADYGETRTDPSHINWEDKFRLCKDNVNDQCEILNRLDPGTTGAGRCQDRVFEKFPAINYCTKRF